MIISTVTPPAAEPVTLSEVKLYCKIDGTEDDALITSLITAARQHAEDYARRAFITQTMEVSYDYDDLFEYGPFIELPRTPIASITSIKSYDDDDTESTMTATDYRLSGDRVVLASGGAWPTSLRDRDAMIIRYVAGYGAAAAVPEQVKTAIKRIVEDLYDNRGDQPTGTISASVELTAHKLLDPFRVYRL